LQGLDLSRPKLKEAVGGMVEGFMKHPIAKSLDTFKYVFKLFYFLV